MTAAQVVGYCFVAFGIGYAGGALIRMARKSFEVLE